MSTSLIPRIRLKIAPPPMSTPNPSVLPSPNIKAPPEKKKKNTVLSASNGSEDGGGVFAEYKAALKKAREYKLKRGWSLKQARLQTCTGYSLNLTEWCTLRHTVLLRTSASSPKRGGRKKAAAIPNGSTFVCSHQGCHRIFDDAAKWKRHQNGHIRYNKDKPAASK